MCWPLLSFCRPFCMDSNAEHCHSKLARYQLSSVTVSTVVLTLRWFDTPFSMKGQNKDRKTISKYFGLWVGYCPGGMRRSKCVSAPTPLAHRQRRTVRKESIPNKSKDLLSGKTLVGRKIRQQEPTEQSCCQQLINAWEVPVLAYNFRLSFKGLPNI